MQYCTRNPALKKPEYSDARDIADINDNMDTIDSIISKGNYNAAIDPTINDDIEDGYAVNSTWLNTTDHRQFVAESVATGAAVWRQIYPAITHQPYDVIVYQSGTTIYAENADTTIIDSGIVGTDDTDVIQAAIDATPDDGILYIGPGTYSDLEANTQFALNTSTNVYTAFLITNGNNIKIYGAGIDKTILKFKASQHYADHPAIMFLNRAAGEIDNGYTSFEISDMTLDGNWANQSTTYDFDGAALILTGSTRSGGRYQRLKLLNYCYGLYSGNNGSGPESNVIITDIICDGMYRDGVQLDTVTNATISNIIAKLCKSGLTIYGNTDYATRNPDGISVTNISCVDSGFCVWCINDAVISNINMNVENLTNSYGLIVHDSIGVKFSNCKFVGPDSISGTYGKASYITGGMDGVTDVNFSDCYFSAYNAFQVLGSAVAHAKDCTFRGTNACIYLKDVDAVTCSAELIGCEINPVTTALKWNVANGATLTLKDCSISPVTSAATEDGNVYEINSMLSGIYQQALLNSEFQINQHAVSPYTSGTTPDNKDDTYLFDQWILLSDGNDIVDVSQSTSVVPIGGATAAKFEVETANKKFGILQIIENADALKFAGKSVSLQFKAYTVTDKLIKNIRAAVLSWNSTANAVTSDVVSSWGAEGTNPTWSTNWTAENTASNLALVADKWTQYKIENIKIDTASMKNLAVFIWVDDTDAAIDDLLYISQVQLNEGSRCTPYTPMSFTEDLLKCKRFYEKSYIYETAPGTSNTAVGLVLAVGVTTGSIKCISRGFQTPKVGTTTVTIYNYQGTINKVNDTGTTEIGTTVVSGTTERDGIRGLSDSGNPFTVGAFYQFHWVADARL